MFEDRAWVDERRGRCVACGFFGKHALVTNVPTPNYYECDNQVRLTGRAFTHTADAFQGAIQAEPVCFVGTIYMVDDSARVQTNYPDREQALKAVIDREDRNCKDWYPYTPGFGPIQAYERKRMDLLEKESARRDRDSSKRDTRSFWAFVFIGFVGLIFAGAQIWAELRGNDVGVTVNISTPMPTQSVPDIQGDLPQEAD